MGVFTQVAKLVDEGAKRIKAYHGSPHDFDKFSTENIGTGEGAQAYGHGLYFAEREATAKSYKDQLTPRDFEYEDYLGKQYKDAEKFQDYGRMEMLEKAMMHDTPKDFRDIALDADYDDDYRQMASDMADEIDNFVSPSGKPANFGRMYEVDINASPDEMLDYDVPLNTQSPKVQKAIDELMDSRGVESYVRDGGDGAEKIYIGTGLGGKNTGSEILRTLTGERGPAGASKILNDVGIKGIKYADAQTRFSPKGRTNNYVMFDDKTIEIARKYGVSMPVAGAILAGTMTPEDAQAASIPKVTRDLMNKYFTPEAVEYATKQADARKSREAITEIDIDDFLNLAREGYSPQKAEGIASVSQFDDLPFLSIKEEDGIANVVGHEGRHRARRLKEMGESKMPIRVRSDIRWDQQNDPKAFDYLHDYPRILFNEDRTKKTPFPFRQGESNFIPSEFMDIQDISRAKKQRKSEFTVSDDELLKKLGLGSSAALSSGSTLASSQDGLLKDTGDVLGEIMAGANRGVVDALNFFTVDQVNAISQLMGSDKRVPTLYDVPQIKDATSGNFMEKGALRQAVRQGSEFLSPI